MYISEAKAQTQAAKYSRLEESKAHRGLELTSLLCSNYLKFSAKAWQDKKKDCR